MTLSIYPGEREQRQALQNALVQTLLRKVRTVLRNGVRVERGLYRIDPADWLAMQSAAAQVGRFADGKGGS